MSAAKLLVMVTMILTCFVISMGGQPSGKPIGFTYWDDPGAFGTYLLPGAPGRLLAFWSAMVQSTFAYTGTEVVGIAFGEAPDPKRTIKKAVRQTLWRITFFYIIGALALGMSVPYTDARLIGGTEEQTGAGASPFVIAVRLAGIPHYPDVINACLLLFVLSAANSDIYIGSRTLFGLAHDGQAPAVFRRTSRQGVPLAGVAFMSLFIALAYMNASNSSAEVFGYLVSLVTVFGALNWINVLVAYVWFMQGMRAQGIPRSSMPYQAMLQPYGAYVALFMTILLVFFNGMSRIPRYISKANSP